MFNIIERLHETATPTILSQASALLGGESDKKNLLSTVYGLLVARLSNDDAVKHLESLPSETLGNGQELLGLLFGGTDEQDSAERSKRVTELMGALAEKFNLTPDTTTGLTATALPVVYTQLQNMSGTMPLATYLQEHKSSVLARLPAWLSTLLPAGLLGAFGLSASAFASGGELVAAASSSASLVTTPDSATATTKTMPDPVHVAAPAHPSASAGNAPEGSGFAKTLLPIIGLLVAGGIAMLAVRGCQKDPAPVAKPTAVEITSAAAAGAEQKSPSTFNLALDGEGKNIISCGASVSSSGILDNVKAVIAGAFGNADKCQLVLEGQEVMPELSAGEYLPRILGFMKGVPDASVSISDKLIRFNAATPEAVEKLIIDTKAILPSDFTVEAEPAIDVVSVVESSLRAANSAIEGLTAESGVDELVQALNMQIINFEVNSSEIPEENKAILDKAALKLNELPNARLRIIGHTDNTGDHGRNQKLSESRAKAVHDYLVSKGVSDDRLEILGASSDQPIASNATEQGRFRNRRIEFAIIQDGEQVATIGAAAEGNVSDNETAKTDASTESAAQ